MIAIVLQVTQFLLQDSPVVSDPVANSGGADEKKVKKPRGLFKKKEKQSVI